MDLSRIVSRVASKTYTAAPMPEPMPVDKPPPMTDRPQELRNVQFHLFGTVSVDVPVDPSWLDDDGDLLPQYRDRVRNQGESMAAAEMDKTSDNVDWQLEFMSD